MTAANKVKKTRSGDEWGEWLTSSVKTEWGDFCKPQIRIEGRTEGEFTMLHSSSHNVFSPLSLPPFFPPLENRSFVFVHNNDGTLYLCLFFFFLRGGGVPENSVD